ncbi:MAG: sialidase family protein, partial [Thermomicrobiales bacterium]
MRSRTTSRSRRQANASAGRRLGNWLALFLLLALSPPMGVEAEEPGKVEFIPLGGLTLDPIKDSLSASSWLAAQGLDPRLLASGAERNPVTGLDWAMAAGGSGPSSGSGGLNQQVPFRNPAPAFSRNLIISRQVGLFPLQTEPHIAVDPFDPEHLVMGTIDYNFPAISTYTSFDGGETWEGPHQVRYFREDFTGAGDPVIAFDSLGNVYATMISVGIEEFTIGNLTSFAEVSSMIVAKSLDGGITWEEPVSAARSTTSSLSQVDDEGRERGLITLSFLDKPWLAVGPNPNNPDQESIYLSYTNFDTTYGILYSDEVPFLSSPFTETTIRVVRSDDGGVTWTDPIPVSPTVLQAEGASEEGEGGAAAIGVVPQTAATQADDGDGDPFTQQQQVAQSESERTVQGSQPKVMADGTVVIAYLDTTNDGIQEGLATIMVVLSTDGGRTYSQPIQAGIIREPHFRTRSAFFRYWGAAFPQLALGPNNEIYILATGLPPEKPTDDGDIYLFRSLDGGTTWEEAVKLNLDDTSRPQFFPSIAVSPDGTLHAMWGDMRDDPDEVRYHIYYSRSEDQGTTWGFTLPDQDFTAPDTRVTDFPSNSLRGFPNGLFIGDYFSIAATEDEVYMVWADTRLGEFGGPNQQIAFARQSAIRSPELFLNPPSGPSGRTIDIQGFGFQPDSNILLLVGGVIVSNERTDDEGLFQTQIFMPVTGEGASNISAFDETGNAATASFYTEFGFDNIQDSLDRINQQLGIQTAVPSAPPAGTPAGTPGVPATPVGTPGASPVATPTGSPVASSEGGAVVSSGTGAAFGGFGAAGLIAGVIATTGAFWWR